MSSPATSPYDSRADHHSHLFEGAGYFSLRSLPAGDWLRIWANVTPRNLPQPLAADLQASIASVCVQAFTFVAALAACTFVMVTVAFVNLETATSRIWTALHVFEFMMIGAAVWSLRDHLRAGTLSARRVNFTTVIPVVLGGFLWGTLPLVVGSGHPQDLLLATTISSVCAVVGFFWTAGHWPLSMTFSGLIIASIVTIFWLHDHPASDVVSLLGPFLVACLFVLSLLAGASIVRSRYIEARAHEREHLIGLMMRDYDGGGQDFLWDTDPSLRLTHVSPRMVTASRGDPRVAVGTSLRTLVGDQPDVRAALDAMEPFQTEFATQGPDGHGAIRLWGHPKYAAGRRYGYSGVGTDADAARRAAETERANERLDALVALTSGLAHDFNNQLATVMGAVELAALDPGLGGHTNQYLKRAIDACVRTRRITTDLVVASGHDATYEPVPFDACEAVNEVARDLAPVFPDVAIHTTTRTSNIWVDTDKSHFTRAIHNLIQNACQAIDEASITGGEVTATVTTSGIGPDAVAVTEIADNGPGVSPSVADRVFEPFVTSRRAAGGTGLGLSVARGFARQAGGLLTLVPSARGARFLLTVPRYYPDMPDPSTTTPPDPSATPPPPPTRAPRTDSGAGQPRLLTGRFLVVEADDSDRYELGVDSMAGNVQAWIESFGGSVHRASTVGGALEVATDLGGDLVCVISDLGLPDGKGFDIIGALMAFKPTLSRVYMSSVTVTLASPVARELRGPFLSKPFSCDNLIAALDTAGVPIGS